MGLYGQSSRHLTIRACAGCSLLCRTALQDEFANFPSLCCPFSAQLPQRRVTGGDIRDVPVRKSVWNVSRKRTTLIAMALLEAASRCRYSRRRWEGGNARCAHSQYTAGTKGRGCVCGSMVSALQKQVRRHHQTQAMSRAAGQTGSTGMPARVRLGLASERANRTHARIVVSPTRRESHNSHPAAILEAKLLL